MNQITTIDVYPNSSTIEYVEIVNGAIGAQGAQGEQGPPGPTGPTGAEGLQGPQGGQGPAGAQGPASTIPGPPGLQGSTGPQGPEGPAGPQGLQGDKGDIGADGAEGPAGASSSVFQYRFDAGTAANDPGAGRFRFNTATQIDATALYIDRLTQDNFDVTTIFQMIGAQDSFVLQDKTLALHSQIWSQTGPAIDHSDWFEVPITFVSSDGTLFIGNQNISLLLKSAGVQGPPGPAGPEGPQGSIGPQGLAGSQGPIGPVGPASTVPGPQGPVGPQGPQGVAGDTGPAGPPGSAATGVPEAPSDNIQYARKNATWTEVVQQSYGSLQNYMFNAGTSPPPASGGVRFNNVAQNLVTNIYLNYVTNDSNAVNLKTYFTQRFRTGDTFYFQDKDDTTKWQLYRLNAPFVDNGTYATLPVTWLSGGGSLTAAKVIATREGASVASPIGEAPNDGKQYVRQSTSWQNAFPSYAVAGLPAAATVGAGVRAFVTDANAATFGTVVAAGGANKVPVYSDGAAWRIG